MIKKISIIFLFLCFLILQFFGFSVVQAADKFEPVPPKVQLKYPGLKFGEITTTTEEGKTYLNIPWIADFISAFFKFFIGGIAILATVMIMWGGFLWLTAAGNPTQIGTATTRITDALIGLVLALGSFLILNTINPTLVKLKGIKIQRIGPVYQKLAEANKSGMLCTISKEESDCCCYGWRGCGNMTNCYWKEKKDLCHLPAAWCPDRCEELSIPKPAGIIIGNVKNNWWIVNKIAGVKDPCPTYCEIFGSKKLIDEQQGNDICCACKGEAGLVGHISGDTRKLAREILDNPKITKGTFNPTCGNTSKEDLEEWAKGNPVETCPADQIGNKCFSNTITPNPVLLGMINETGKDYKFTITAFTGGIHGKAPKYFSYHYSGNAVDLDNLEDKNAIKNKFYEVFNDFKKYAGNKNLKMNWIEEETHVHVEIEAIPSTDCGRT